MSMEKFDDIDLRDGMFKWHEAVIRDSFLVKNRIWFCNSKARRDNFLKINKSRRFNYIENTVIE
jgi:hypothetical protein